MQKLKSVFNPGHKKDAEVMYGSRGGENRDSDNQGSSPKQESDLAGVKRQILNPGGDKYDAAQYGQGASSTLPENTQQQVQTNPEQKEHGVLKQLLNPGGHKADATAFGDTATAGSSTGETSTGTTAPTQEAGALPTVQTTGGRFMDTPADGPSSDPLASGAARSGGVSTGSNTTSEPAVGHPGCAGIMGEQPSTSQHHSGRDAALAGAGAATAGGMYEHEKRMEASQLASETASTTAVKDFPATAQPTSTTSSNLVQPASSAVYPTSTSTNTQQENHHLGRDAATVGGTGMALAGAEAAWRKHERPKDDYDFNDPSPYSLRAVDPRIDTITRRMPGAWPRGDSYQSEAPQDTRNDQLATEPTATATNEPEVKSHDFGRDATVAGGIGAAGLGAHEMQKDPRNQEPYPDVAAADHAKATEPVLKDIDGRTHQYGRDAVAAGGLGAVGIGAYEADKHLKEKENVFPQTTDPAMSAVKPEQHIAATEPDLPLQPTQPEHYYGRDAAVAGEAGAAGMGAYETYKHHEESKTTTEPTTATETAPPTIDRAQPVSTATESASMTPQAPTTRPEPQHHYGRDDALAGGVGAAGVGVYEAEKHHKADAAPQKLTTTSTDQASTSAIPLPEKIYPEHHYDRDAAIIGGTGAATYEADKHLLQPDEKAAVRNVPAATHTEPAVSQLDDYSQTDAAPFIAQIAEEPQPQHHYGRDAAIAGGAGTAMWFGADEVEKKHRLHDSMDPELANVAAHIQPRYEDQRAEMHDHMQPRYENQRAEMHDHSAEHPRFLGATESLPAAKSLKGKEPAADVGEQHHLGRDAALGGGLGAAGVGAYEAGKYHQSKEDEPIAADDDNEYVKNNRKEHVTPERTSTHLRKHSKEEKEKHGSVLGKIFHRKSRSNMANEAAIADESEKERSPIDTSAKYGVGAEDLAQRSHDSPPTASLVEQYSSTTPERHTSTLTPTRSPTEKRHSPKHSGEFAHLGRNKLHKEPRAKYLEKRERERGDGSGSNSSPSRMTSSGTRHMATDGDPYGVSGLPEGGAYRGVDSGGAGPTGSVVMAPHAGLPMGVGSGAVEGFQGGLQDLSNYDGPEWGNGRKNDTIY